MSVPPAAPFLPGPVPRAERSLAPDVARGLMLLFIAVANVWSYLYARETGLGMRPVDAGGWDRTADTVVALLVDDRARPLFAILYGYGIATMVARMAARGVTVRKARRVLARRSVALVVLGLLHAALLFFGDILAPYGVTGLVALALVHRRRVVLRRWFVVGLVGYLLASVAQAAKPLLMDDGGLPWLGPANPTYAGAVVDGLLASASTVVVSALTLYFLAPVLIGVHLARSGLLDRPAEDRARLLRVFWVAMAVNLVANTPWALAVGGWWSPGEVTAALVGLAHQLSGLVMAVGYVYLFAWLAGLWQERGVPAVGRAVGAVGRRSLTCYLLQSVMFAPLLMGWGLGLGGRIGTATATLLAAAVWGVTVLVAVGLERAGRTGPFEVLLRRLTYGRRVAPASTGPGTSPGAGPQAPPAVPPVPAAPTSSAASSTSAASV